MIIDRIKFYQSVKCNTRIANTKGEFNYMDCDRDGYEVIFKDNLISITNLESKELTYTAMSNVVYFSPKIMEKKNAKG